MDPYPFFSILQQAGYDGTTIYHGMNVRVQKKYSHGLSFNVAYTVSKRIDNAFTANQSALLVDAIHGGAGGVGGGRAGFAGIYGAGFKDPDNYRDRIISAEDIPQMFNVYASYEFPVGKGKPFLNRTGILNGILGGWKLGGTFDAQRGIPLNISCPANDLLSTYVTGIRYSTNIGCNLIGDPAFKGNRSKAERIKQWINPAAFEAPFGSNPDVISVWSNGTLADGTPLSDEQYAAFLNRDEFWRFGNAGARLPGIRSPGFWNMDTSLYKRFNITEKKYFEFRWEMFNALNHQNLGFPDTNWCLPPKPDGSTDVVHQAGCTFGRITNIQTDPRSMEFALKFFF